MLKQYVCIEAMICILMMSMGSARAQSAIGQLETLTGQKIQRPSSFSQSSSFSPSSSAMSALGGCMTILNMIDSMDSAPQQQQAQAQWQAEQQRILEEQRQQAQRVLTAQHLRDFWDHGDANLAQNLSGTLDMPGQGTHFFGSSPNPDSTMIDDILSAPMDFAPPPPPVVGVSVASVVTPQPAASAPLQTAEPMVEISNAAPSPEVEISIKDVANTLAKDVLGVLKEKVIQSLPGQWQAELISEHGEKMNSFIENLFESLEPDRLVHTLASGSVADHQRLLNDLGRVDREAAMLGVHNSPVDARGLETLREWLKQRKVSMNRAGSMIVDSTRQFAVEKQIDRLLLGDM